MRKEPANVYDKWNIPVVFFDTDVLSVLLLLTIVLSVLLLYTDSDYPFGVYKLFLPAYK
jgi:hypothetical protein